MEKIELRGGPFNGVTLEVSPELDWLDMPLKPHSAPVLGSRTGEPLPPDGYESYRRSRKTRTIFVHQP